MKKKEKNSPDQHASRFAFFNELYGPEHNKTCLGWVGGWGGGGGGGGSDQVIPKPACSATETS